MAPRCMSDGGTNQSEQVHFCTTGATCESVFVSPRKFSACKLVGKIKSSHKCQFVGALHALFERLCRKKSTCFAVFLYCVIVIDLELELFRSPLQLALSVR